MPAPIAREFPLLLRELTHFGSRRYFYAIRVAAPVLALPVLFLASGVSSVTYESLDTLAGFGQFVGQICLLFQFVVVFIGAPVWGANAISREKDQDTLPLLLLADMRGFDIIVSKLLGAYGPVAALLFAALPVMFLGTFVGAPVSVIAAHMLFTLALGFYATAAGLFSATLRINAVQAANAAIAISLFYGIGVTALSIWRPEFDAFAPKRTWEALQFMTPEGTLHYAAAAAIPILLGTVMTLLAWCNLPLHANPVPAKPRLRTGPVTTGFLRPSVPARILMRTTAGMAGMGSGVTAKVLTAAFIIALGCIPVLGGIVIFAIVAYDIFTTNQRLKESAALDDLLTTSMSDRELAHAMVSASLYRLWIVLPGLIVAQAVALTFMSGGRSISDGGVVWIGTTLVAAPVAAYFHYLFVVCLACGLSLYLRSTVAQLLVALFFYIVLNVMISSGTMALYAFASVLLGSLLSPLLGTTLIGAATLPLAVLGPGALLKSLAALLFYREFRSDFGKLLRVESGMGMAPAPRERW